MGQPYGESTPAPGKTPFVSSPSTSSGQATRGEVEMRAPQTTPFIPRLPRSSRTLGTKGTPSSFILPPSSFRLHPSAGLVPRHFGNVEQPQNELPACAPLRAVLRTIGEPHCGHAGTSPVAVVTPDFDPGSRVGGWAPSADDFLSPRAGRGLG